MLAGDRGRHHLAALVVGLDLERGGLAALVSFGF